MQADVQNDATEGANASRDLIRRAPSGFLWYQAFIFWLFISGWLVNLVVINNLPPEVGGVYVLVITVASSAVVLASLGLGNAASVFLPRVLAEEGPGQAMALALRLIAVRAATVLALSLVVLWVLPLVADLLATTNLPGTANLAQSLSGPQLTAHRLVLVAYLIAYGMSNLLAALLIALLRTRTVFVVSSAAQLAAIGASYFIIVALHGGADGAILAQALAIGLGSIVYLLTIQRLLAAHARPAVAPRMGPVLRLSIVTWLADLVNGSFVKPLAQAQLAFGLVATLVAAGTSEQIARSDAVIQNNIFDQVFKLGHSAVLVGVEGLGAVSIAIMSTAFEQGQRKTLATAWRTIVKLHVLLAVPVVIFCVPHATAIMHALFRVFSGATLAAAGRYLALFLVMNALIQLAGGGSQEPALYVLGLQRWALISRWGSLGVIALGDVLLIPRFGTIGVLFAVGLSQFLVEVFQLVIVRKALVRSYPWNFIGRMLLALIIPAGVTVLWRPSSLAGLVVAGAVFAVLFVACLWLIKPLDAEDGALLNQLAKPLRTALRPFVNAAARGLALPVHPSIAVEPVLAAPTEGTPLSSDPASRASHSEP